jgi:hypothetical protein
MYDKRIREEFWTRFGQYLALQQSASGERVNWLNYKTGVRQIQLRIEVTDKSARIVILLSEPDLAKQTRLFNQFVADKASLDTCSETFWHLGSQTKKAENAVCVLYQELEGVNINLRSDWPAIISFLKPLMICFDQFWTEQKELYQLIGD